MYHAKEEQNARCCFPNIRLGNLRIGWCALASKRSFIPQMIINSCPSGFDTAVISPQSSEVDSESSADSIPPQTYDMCQLGNLGFSPLKPIKWMWFRCGLELAPPPPSTSKWSTTMYGKAILLQDKRESLYMAEYSFLLLRPGSQYQCNTTLTQG